jgi:hypothetical protein
LTSVPARALNGTVNGKPRRWDIYGQGKELGNQVRYGLLFHPPREPFETTDVETLSRNRDKLMSNLEWDRRPEIES